MSDRVDPTALLATAPMVLHYRRQYYQETVEPNSTTANSPLGLVGREVANAELLTAMLKYSRQPALDFLLQENADARAIEQTLAAHDLSQKRIRLGPINRAEAWLSKGAGSLLWQPQPPSASWAWLRRRISQSNQDRRPHFAISGITHALCSPAAITSLRELVTAPIEPFDRLICTSAAVAATARAILDHWIAVVDGNGDLREPIRLETIPLGVDTDRHRPTTAAGRADSRRRHGIAMDATVVLFVGRLSHHAKSNPMVTMAACQAASQQSRQPIALVMAGWFASTAVRDAFRVEAARLAPDVQSIFVDGTDPTIRETIWHAADVFVSLADSIQETFGLTVVEAASRGLPVVASDWNGYRETVVDGVTGYLIPTSMVHGVGDAALVELIESRLSYDHYLARVGQGVIVNPRATAEAITRLVIDPPLRAQLGRAGHEHAKANFAWPKIIARLEDLWDEQRFQLHRSLAPLPKLAHDQSSITPLPSAAPEFDRMFQNYPTEWLDGQTPIVVSDQALGGLDEVTRSPLSGHSAAARWNEAVTNEAIRSLVSDTRGKSIDSIVVGKARPGELNIGRETLAWALKFDLIRSIDTTPAKAAPTQSSTDPEKSITFATTCMGRLDHLRQTLPRWIDLPDCRVVVVDYSCPDRAGEWVRSNFDPAQVSVVDVTGRTRFDRSEAKNTGILAATTPWVCLIDADITPAPDFLDQIRPLMRAGRVLRSSSILEGTGGTFVARREDLVRVEMHDLVYQGWGEEDDDLLDALQFAGLALDVYSNKLIDHIDHEDSLRTQYHDHADRRRSHMVNRIYRAAKWDMARLASRVPPLAARRKLYTNIEDQLNTALLNTEPVTITIDTGRMNWVPLAASCARQLSYLVQVDERIQPGQYARKT